MADNVRPVSEPDFQREVLQSELPVLVNCWAPWCGWCRFLDPVLDQLAGEYHGRIKFVKVNADENPDLSEAYRVATLPTLLFFHRGQLLGREVEADKPPELRMVLDQWLAQATASAP